MHKRAYRFVAVLSLSLGLFLSCEEQQEQLNKLKVTPSELFFAKAADTQTLTVETNSTDWKATAGDCDWITLDKTSGSGNDLIQVSVTENGSGERRTAQIKVSSKGFLTARINVAQEPVAELINPSAKGLFSIPELPDADEGCTLYYRAVQGDVFYGYTNDLYAHIGLVEAEWTCVQADWGENIPKCKWQPCEEKNLWKLSIAPSIREWFSSGELPATKIGVVVRSSDGAKQTEDLFVKVQDSKFTFEPDPVVKETMPAGALQGINYNADGSVTLVLYDKDSKGASHDWCYAIGDFSDWKRRSEYAMKRDDAAGSWWITITGVQPGREYLFQYYLGSSDGSVVKTHDPYTEIVYDGSNDKYISSSTYPDLTPYPSGTSGFVGAFCSGTPEYSWTDGSFRVADVNDLLIYEMHLRDFTQSGDLNGALEKMDYLSALGINAIELMPIQEFEGNDSWGYNPLSYFALDKAYGSREKYKEFINACHSKGIAVIADVVYNHATGAHPYAKLHWDAANNRTASVNPWFNVEAPHPYSVFHDWNHENKLVREHIKRSLVYLIEEYHIDGFRFDLTKGFTNRKCDESTASNYDQSRIDILKDYNSAIKAANPDAIVILEHFCETREENALARDGMKVWRNLNYAFCQSAMGMSSGSEFSGLWTGSSMPFGSLVGFAESHDEERTAFKSKTYAEASIKNSIDVRMQREEAGAAMFLTVPGPKMLWQFQELGYDESIETNGRTGRKPLHWEYLNDADRKALYDTYCLLGAFRKDNPELFKSTADFKYNASAWNSFRTASSVAGGKAFIAVANMDTASHTSTVNFPVPGTWRNFNKTAETYSGSSASITLGAGEWRLFVNY